MTLGAIPTTIPLVMAVDIMPDNRHRHRMVIIMTVLGAIGSPTTIRSECALGDPLAYR